MRDQEEDRLKGMDAPLTECIIVGFGNTESSGARSLIPVDGSHKILPRYGVSNMNGTKLNMVDHDRWGNFMLRS